jgi:hypothetical protein
LTRDYRVEVGKNTTTPWNELRPFMIQRFQSIPARNVTDLGGNQLRVFYDFHWEMSECDATGRRGDRLTARRWSQLPQPFGYATRCFTNL